MGFLRDLFQSCFKDHPTEIIQGKSVESEAEPDESLKKGPRVVQRTTTEISEIHEVKKAASTIQELSKAKNRALVVTSERKYAIVEDFGYPSVVKEREVVIKTKAVGLNPIDWKSVDFNFCLPEFPWITGREMAGVVEEVGENVMECKVGDRVWTSKFIWKYLEGLI